MINHKYDIEISKIIEHDIESYLACVSKIMYDGDKYLSQDILYLTQGMSKQMVLLNIKKYLQMMKFDDKDIVYNSVPEQILEWNMVVETNKNQKISALYYLNKDILCTIEDNRTQEELKKYADHIMKIQNYLDNNNMIENYEFEVEI